MSSARTLLLAAIFVITSIAVSLDPAQAQAPDLSTDDVTVDLSVIDNPGAALATAPFMAPSRTSTPRMGLMVPGSKTPVSRLHVAVPKATGRIKLKEPGSKPKTAAKRRVVKKTKKKTPIKKAEITKPAPPTVSAPKPPAPLSATPPAAPVVAAAPMKQKTAKMAPAAPPAAAKKAVEKPMAGKAEKPAVKMPETPKAAPPPAPAPMATAAKTEMKPEAAAAKKEQAALPPAPETTKTGKTFRVEFDAKASKFPAKAKKGLQDLAKKLKGKDNLRLQLMAYAGGKTLSASRARRLSLSRALSVRSFLIESGVRSTRIDVRALGNKTTEKPANRVDVNIVER